MDDMKWSMTTTDDDPDSPVKLPPPKKPSVKGTAASKLKTAQKKAEEIFANLKDGKELECYWP